MVPDRTDRNRPHRSSLRPPRAATRRDLVVIVDCRTPALHCGVGRPRRPHDPHPPRRRRRRRRARPHHRTGCVSSGGGGGGGGQPAGNAWGTATSAATGGGMDALVAAAKKEGALNVIALPPDWANYGAHHRRRSQNKYGINDELGEPRRVQPGRDQRRPAARHPGPRARTCSTSGSRSPTPTSPCSRRTRSPRGTRSPRPTRTRTAPGSTTTAATSRSAATPSSSPTCPTTFADLLKPEYKGQVALNGDPTQAAAAFAGRVGGGAGQRRLARQTSSPASTCGARSPRRATCSRSTPTPATIQSGQTPIVLDWDYLNVTQAEKIQGVVRLAGRRARRTACSPSTTRRRSTRTRRTRRRPGCGRSSSTPTRARTSGWPGKSRPVRLDAMQQAGTADKAAASPRCPQVHGRAAVPHPGRDGRGPAGRGQDLGERDGVSPVRDEPARRARRRRRRRRSARPGRGGRSLGLVPFALYLLVFLGGPLYFVISGALSDPDGQPTLENLVATAHRSRSTSPRSGRSLKISAGHGR